MATSYFKDQPAVWSFFANHTHKEEQLKDFKLNLLKNTYKFDEESNLELYDKVKQAKEKLALNIPVILYQAQNTEEINASIVYLDNEAHIVFSGRLIQFLTDQELLAVIAHELSHVQLYTQLNGEVEVADRIITAIANHHSSTPAHYETARLFHLYTEIFCDRGAYLVTGDYAPIISSLVKISTGLQSVNAESYIKQAEEIFASDNSTKTSGVSHPENFIRARAIWLWHNKGNESDPVLREMIEGSVNLEELDLFGQQKLSIISEGLIKRILEPSWMQTPHTLSLARSYFPSITLETPGDINMMQENIHSNIKEYLAYILYDFATNDKTLEDVPLGYCFSIASEMQIEETFFSIVKKEKKLTDKKTSLLKKQCLASLSEQQMQLN